MGILRVLEKVVIPVNKMSKYSVKLNAQKDFLRTSTIKRLMHASFKHIKVLIYVLDIAPTHNLVPKLHRTEL